MATIEQPAGFPNILIVTGNDVTTSNYRLSLRNALYGSSVAVSPVREGTHDFWVTYEVPALGGGSWAFEDLSKRPRRMRGIVEMGPLPATTDENTLRTHLGVMLQEVGHHWLVPSDLRFQGQNALLSMPTEAAVTQAINAEARPSGPPLVARGGSHWSSYWQADASPLDGLYFVRQGQEDGHAVWQAHDFTGPVLSPPGLTPITMRASFNDLDRIVIGTKAPSAAYQSTGGAFRWIEPRLSAPHPFHAGLFVAFGQNDYVTFGFYQDHRTLGVQRTGAGVVTAALGSGYRPLADRFNAVALRIVRRGNAYLFQARYDNPMRAWPAGSAPSLDDDLEPLPPVEASPDFDWKTFRTVARLQIAQDPQAFGALVKKWDHPHLAELAFHGLALFRTGNNQVFGTNAVPAPFAANRAYRLLPNGQLRAQAPVAGPLMRTRSGRLHIIAPFSTANADGSLTHHADFDHSATADRAPKVLAKAPKGDFAVATSAKMWRTIYTPWAGGYARGRTVWGIERSMAAVTTEVPRNIVQDKQPAPFRGTYKVAFIIVAANRGDITTAMIERADTIRRYWDEAFAKATEEQRASDSRLVAGSLRLSPAIINFGSVVVGDGSNPSTIRIINDGPGDLAVFVPASLAGAFRWSEFADTIPPGSEREFEVEFIPTTAGAAHRTLRVETDGVNGPQTVELRGRGVADVDPL